MLLEGEAFFGDTLLRSGDYRFAPAGSPCPRVYSDTGALLFVRSFRNLLTFDPGFRQDGIVLGFVSLGHFNFISLEAYDPVVRGLTERFRSIPGVEAVATSTHVLLAGSSWSLAERPPRWSAALISVICFSSMLISERKFAIF